MRYLLVIGAVAAAVFAAIALGAAQRAQVAIAQTSPVVVTGAGFKVHERVTLTVASKWTRTKRLVTNARGGFKTKLRGFSIPPCTEYWVRATGKRGSRAVLHVIPECPNARQVQTTTTDLGLPSDPGAPKKPR